MRLRQVGRRHSFVAVALVRSAPARARKHSWRAVAARPLCPAEQAPAAVEGASCHSSGAKPRDGLISHALGSGFDKSETEIVASVVLAERRPPGTQLSRTSMSKGAMAPLCHTSADGTAGLAAMRCLMERENAS